MEESGGRVTDLDGKPLEFGKGRALTANRGIVGTNGLLHDRVLRWHAAAHDAPLAYRDALRGREVA